MSAPKRGKCFVTSLLPSAALDVVRETAGLLPISEIKVVKDTQESLHVFTFQSPSLQPSRLE